MSTRPQIRSEHLACLTRQNAGDRPGPTARGPRVIHPATTDADLQRRIALRRGEALDTLLRDWCETEPATRYRDLAMLQLYTLGGWTVPVIGHVFGLAKGHVSRRLHLTAESIRTEFDLDLESFDTDGDSDDDC